MTERCFFVSSVLLLFATVAPANGAYQRTRDGQCLVWNSSAGSANEATWSGKQDANGYATGEGTLTWYKVERKTVVGSLLPSTRKHPVIIARYSGKMVEGKLEGPVVDVDANGKKFHATFFNGALASDWTPGPLPSSAKPRNERIHAEPVVEPPAEGPTSAHAQPGTPSGSEPTGTEAANEGNDSISSLVGPPSSLRMGVLAEASSSPAAQADDAKTVAALDRQYQAAVKANDAATMDRILANDFVLVTGRGGASTKADVIKEAREKQVIYEHQDEQEGTQKVRVWGDTAVVTALLWVKGTEHGQALDHQLWFSDTYVRTPAGWRYVFGQASIPLPTADAK